MTREPTSKPNSAQPNSPTAPEPQPGYVEGRRLLAAGRALEAISHLQQALETEPEHPEILHTYGQALTQLERFPEACQALESSLARGPRDRAAVCNALGRVYERLDRISDAERQFREAIQLHFQLYAAHFNLARLLLSQGRLREGFSEYEWRWQTANFARLPCLQPRWKGQPLNETLLVHTEQGVGDTLQFCRYLPLIRERCRRVIFLCPPRLKTLFPVPHWADQVLFPDNVPADAFDAYLPLLSAPNIVSTELETIPAEVPYLTPEPRTIDLGPTHVTGARLKVGIVWGGSPTHAHEKFRSCPLSEWGPVLDVPGIAFYSLQTAPQRSQLSELSADRLKCIRDLDDLQRDFSDTAAMLRQLDLLITVDTAILHLAGGLALPVWGLLSHLPDWRWLRDRDDSPWYPTLRLFRQSSLGNWAELMVRVVQALRQKLENA